MSEEELKPAKEVIKRSDNSKLESEIHKAKLTVYDNLKTTLKSKSKKDLIRSIASLSVDNSMLKDYIEHLSSLNKESSEETSK